MMIVVTMKIIMMIQVEPVKGTKIPSALHLASR